MKKQNHRRFLKERPHKPEIQRCSLTVHLHKAKDSKSNFSTTKDPRVAWCLERLSCNWKVNGLINANEPVLEHASSLKDHSSGFSFSPFTTNHIYSALKLTILQSRLVCFTFLDIFLINLPHSSILELDSWLLNVNVFVLRGNAIWKICAAWPHSNGYKSLTTLVIFYVFQASTNPMKRPKPTLNLSYEHRLCCQSLMCHRSPLLSTNRWTWAL